MNDLQDRFFSAGVTYKTTSQEARKDLHLCDRQIALCLEELKKHPLVAEAVVVSTCNRLELYGVFVDGVDSLHHAEKTFLSLQGWAGKKSSPAPVAAHAKLVIKSGRGVYRQLISLVSGLSSMIIGETQITSQWKRAFEQAKNAGTVGPYLNRLHQTALSSAKKVRHHTDTGRGTVSLAHAAVNILEKQHRGLGEMRVAVVGGGKIGGLAARFLASKKPQSLYVVNRTAKKAEDLVAELGFGTAVGLDGLPELLGHVDAVITATTASQPIITVPMVERHKHHTAPLELIDLSLSGDVAPLVSEIDDVFLYAIDAIGQIVNSNISRRSEAANDARPIVEAGVNQVDTWVAARGSAASLAQHSRALNAIIIGELKRSQFTKRYGVNPEALEAFKAAIVKKFIARVKRG